MAIFVRAETSADHGPSRRGSLFRLLFPLAMLAAVTALSFANAWPDAVVLDDKFFVDNRRLPDLTEPAELFSGDVWRTSEASSGLYRPALLLSLALDRRMFGGWLPGYHLSNILLQFLVALLLYGFLHHLLRTAAGAPLRADLYALLAALVFAAHPVHTEVVNSAFNRSDMLVSLGGIAGLWWLLHFLESRPALAWAGLGVAYLLAMLCKENAVVIPGLAVILILFLRDESPGRRIRRSMAVLWMLLPLGLYFYMRAHALTAYSVESEDGLRRVADMAAGFNLANLDTAWLLLANWGVGLRLMVWPHPLQLQYPNPATAVAVTLTFMQLALLLLGLVQLRRGRGPLLTALAWYYLALLPASRFIAPGDGSPHLAERYLYFASVGPAIALVFLLAWLGARFTPRRVAALVLLAVLVMMPLTWIRNNDWVTDVRLFEAEYRRSGPEPDTLRLLTGAHFARGNYARGEEICDRHAERLASAQRFALHCGMIYAQRGRFDDAEQAYLQVTEEGDHRASAHSNLARLYLLQDRFKEAVLQFELAIEKEPSPAVKAMRRGFQLAYLYPRDPAMLARARDYFNEAYEIQPMLLVAKNSAQRVEEVLNAMEQQQP